jgi:RHS repeat-associated protein
VLTAAVNPRIRSLGRLTSVSGPGVTAAYTYDGDGNRVAATVNGQASSFDLDLAAGLPTLLSDGTRRYLPGDPSAGYEEGGAWHTALADALGSPLGFVAGGTPSALTRYDPYGNLRAGSADPGQIGFTGEPTDPTGLLNLRARAYDPSLGRFVERDTYGGVAALPATGNRYAYGIGNPLGYVDPSGHVVSYVAAHPAVMLELAATVIVADLCPVCLAGYYAGVAATGHDPITGTSLGDGERLFVAATVLAPVARAFFGPAAEDLALLEREGMAAARSLEREGAALERGILREAGAADTVTARLERMLSGGEPAVNIAPRSVALRYRYVGRPEARTFVTDLRAVEDVIGPIRGSRIGISASAGRSLEKALGLQPGYLESVNIMSIIRDVRGLGPASPLSGNDLFLGPGLGLPGGGPELTIDRLPTAGTQDILQVILEVIE